MSMLSKIYHFYLVPDKNWLSFVYKTAVKQL